MSVSAEDVAAIGRMFRAIDHIDALPAVRKALQRKPRGFALAEGITPCPNCGQPMRYRIDTDIKGMAECQTFGCVAFDSMSRGA